MIFNEERSDGFWNEVVKAVVNAMTSAFKIIDVDIFNELVGAIMFRWWMIMWQGWFWFILMA